MAPGRFGLWPSGPVESEVMAYTIRVQFALWLTVFMAGFAPTLQAAELRVSPTKRHLVKAGKPFFYLADTAWELFLRLDREETDEYLRCRADQGFTVIMAMILGFRPGEDDRNAYGEPPLIGKDPTRPNEEYFQHVDYVVRRANELGLVVALVPSWSDWMYEYVRPGPHPFDLKNARAYGRYVGRRYKDSDVIWVIGGDRNPEGYEDILRAMAAGLDEGDGDRDLLMTFHGAKLGKPIPPENVYLERLCSAYLFGNEPWLDFHGAYSGHQWAYPTYRLIQQHRAAKPTRPVVDLEPCYEDHPYHPDGSRYWASPWKWDGKTRGTAALIRMQAYWAMVAGAAGHTYGCQDVWQFYDGRRTDRKYRATTHWRKALEFPGAAAMGIMRRLFESRRWQELVPDQRMIPAGQAPGESHIQAARAADGSFAFVYIPRGNSVTVDMSKLKAREAIVHWFNPRTGKATRIGRFPCRNARGFDPPTSGRGHDWVLVLDDASRDFPAPGVIAEPKAEDREQ